MPNYFSVFFFLLAYFYAMFCNALLCVKWKELKLSFPFLDTVQ